MTILLDGSAGTALWAMAEEAGVSKVPVWRYSIEHPEFVLELHRRYIAAGSEWIQANTFDANRMAVQRSSDYTVEQVVTASVKLAKQAVEGTAVKVYATFGPLSMMMEPYGDLTAEEVDAVYTEMAAAAVSAGADALVLETFMDLNMAAAAAAALKRFDLPVLVSMTFAKRHRTMMGDTVEKIVEILSALGVDAVGMNCSTGPVEALDIIREFAEKTDLPLYFKPNSGMGDTYDAAQFAEEVAPALELVGYVGGCCGCDDAYIRELKKRL